MLHIVLGLSLFLVLFGCLTPEATPPPPGVPTPQSPSLPGCKMVTITEPYQVTECWNLTFTEEVCDRKALEYAVSAVHTLDLCTQDSDCVGKQLVECPRTCEGAMKRCRMNVTNLDDANAGVWVAQANFTIDNLGFEKEPTSAFILPGETFTFDYTQLYKLGLYGSSMECTMGLVSTPVAEVCHLEGRETTQCDEVTRYKTVEREVCE